jgi:hypothetical protein
MGDTKMLRTQVLGLLAALAIAGCTQGMRTSSEGVQETLVTASATVESVDQGTRQVVLRDNADGSVFTVTAGPEVRNLAQVETGDQVEVDFYQAVTASMADPADTGEVDTAVLTGRAPEGARPGGLAAATTSMVVTLVTYDSNSGLATFRTPDGLTRRAVVPPNLRTFAAARGTGSRVLVSMTEAVAVTITEPQA